jgi:tetratricopeptide (TPR) repeat protein
MTVQLPTLRKYQFFQVGYRLRSQGFSGILELLDEGGKIVISFVGGTPVRATSTEVALSFPAFLIMKRRVRRQEMREHLEEASRRGMKIDDLLLAAAILTPKDLLRLKRELSLYVFAMAFHKDRVGWHTLAGGNVTEELPLGREVLELHEGLFRAVALDRDTDFLSRMFHGRWDTSLAKTADFYRYLIQFRSVFYGEDISDLLLEPGASAQKIMEAAEDRESAIRQLFALTYSGMLTFESVEESAGDAGTGEILFAGENAAATEGQTMVILPKEEEQAQVTSFLGEGEVPFGEDAPLQPALPPRPKTDVEKFLELGFAAPPPDEKPDFELDVEPQRKNDTVPRISTADIIALEADEPSGPPPQAAPEPVPTPAADEAPEPSPVTAQAPQESEPACKVVPEELDESTALDTPMPEPEPPRAEVPAQAAPSGTAAPLIPEAAAAPGLERAAARTLRVGAPSDDGVEDLLAKALEEAERVTEANRIAARNPVTEPVAPQVRLEDVVRLALKDPPPVPERPPMPEAGTDESIERILEEVYRGMLSRNLYQVLNVTPFTPLSSVRDSATRLRAKYSAGQFSRYILSVRARRLLEYIGQEVERAETVLTELGERTVYDNRVGTDYGQDRRVALSFLFDAEEAFLAGVVLAERNEWAEALQRFTRAAELNPRDPEYLARRGWATYQALRTGQSTDSFAPNKARNILERALAVDPRHAHAMLYLARIEKEMENLDAARTWYERLQKVEPASEEAAIAVEKLRSMSRENRKAESVSMWERFKGIFRRK